MGTFNVPYYFTADQAGYDCSSCFGDPEGMPYSNSSKNFAEDEGSGNDDQYISAQRDDQGRGSLSQTLQCAAGR